MNRCVMALPTVELPRMQSASPVIRILASQLHGFPQPVRHGNRPPDADNLPNGLHAVRRDEAGP